MLRENPSTYSAPHPSENAPSTSPTDTVVDLLHHVDAHISPNLALLLSHQLAFDAETGIHTLQTLYLTGLIYQGNIDMQRAAALHDIGKNALFHHVGDLESYLERSNATPQRGAETRTDEDVTRGHLHPYIGMLMVNFLALPDNMSTNFSLRPMTASQIELTRFIATEHHETDASCDKPSYPRANRRFNGYTPHIHAFSVIDMAAALAGDRAYRKQPLTLHSITLILKSYFPRQQPLIDSLIKHLTNHETFFRAPMSSVGSGLLVPHHGKLHPIPKKEHAHTLLRLNDKVWHKPANVDRIARLEEELYERGFHDHHRQNHIN